MSSSESLTSSATELLLALRTSYDENDDEEKTLYTAALTGFLKVDCLTADDDPSLFRSFYFGFLDGFVKPCPDYQLLFDCVTKVLNVAKELKPSMYEELCRTDWLETLFSMLAEDNGGHGNFTLWPIPVQRFMIFLLQQEYTNTYIIEHLETWWEAIYEVLLGLTPEVSSQDNFKIYTSAVDAILLGPYSEFQSDNMSQETEGVRNNYNDFVGNVRSFTQNSQSQRDVQSSFEFDSQPREIISGDITKQ